MLLWLKYCLWHGTQNTRLPMHRSLQQKPCNSVEFRSKRVRKLLPQFPELEHIHQNYHGKRILDGELIVFVNSRYELQKRTLSTNSFNIQLAKDRCSTAFVTYDILLIPVPRTVQTTVNHAPHTANQISSVFVKFLNHISSSKLSSTPSK